MGSKLSQIGAVTLEIKDLAGNGIMTLPAKEVSIEYNSYDLYGPQEVEMEITVNDEVLKELTGVPFNTSDGVISTTSTESETYFNSFESICNSVSDNLTNRIEELVKSFIDVNSPEIYGGMYIDTFERDREMDKKLEF